MCPYHIDIDGRCKRGARLRTKARIKGAISCRLRRFVCRARDCHDPDELVVKIVVCRKVTELFNCVGAAPLASGSCNLATELQSVINWSPKGQAKWSCPSQHLGNEE